MSETIIVVQEVTEVVEVSTPGVQGPTGEGVPPGGTEDQVLAKASAADFDTEWVTGGGGGASAAEDVEFTPAGNLAATDVQDALEELDSEKAATTHAHAGEDITSGTVADARIAATIARDSEVATAVSDHSADTTSVHGIADTSVLATDSEVATAVSDHSADTTSVHGIADTSVLATDAEVATAVSDHSADTTSVHGIADTSALATDSEVATAVSDHSADTTAVHGIADTSALALTANHPTNATFNDHSARHEDGGADEISIAGLAGTSVALQAHLDDVADAHDASAVSLADAGGNYTATEAEAAFTEVADRGGVFWDEQIRKTADESVTSSTTLQDDNELQFPVSADQPYYFELFLRFEAGATGDIKHALAVTAGLIKRCWRNHDGLGPTTAVAQSGVVADASTVIVNASANNQIVRVTGYIETDTTTTVKLQWAQNASDGTATTVKAGSILRYRWMA